MTTSNFLTAFEKISSKVLDLPPEWILLGHFSQNVLRNRYTPFKSLLCSFWKAFKWYTWYWSLETPIFFEFLCCWRFAQKIGSAPLECPKNEINKSGKVFSLQYIFRHLKTLNLHFHQICIVFTFFGHHSYLTNIPAQLIKAFSSWAGISDSLLFYSNFM